MVGGVLPQTPLGLPLLNNYTPRQGAAQGGNAAAVRVYITDIRPRRASSVGKIPRQPNFNTQSAEQ
jgi:hypothetical protein